MSTWRSAFLHEFPSGNPRNYLGPPGSLSLVEFGLAPNLQPEGFLINPSRWLRYDFNDRYEDVIGMDVTIRGTASIPLLLIFPPVPSAYFQVASIGNGALKLFIALEGKKDVARVQVSVGGQVLSFENLNIPNTFGQVPFTLRARWHTTGQVHIWLNDVLVAYQPDHAVGASFTVGDVAIGSPHETPGRHIPSMDVSHFYVKVLRKTEAEIKLAQEIDLELEYVDPTDPCWERIAKIQDGITAKYRSLMSTVVSELTQAWRNSDTEQPFSNDAVVAHGAAKQAFEAFVAFLRSGDQQSRDDYLVNIEKFLTIVAATAPDGYAALLVAIEQSVVSFDDECRSQSQIVYDANVSVLAPIKKLMDETKSIAVNVSGVL